MKTRLCISVVFAALAVLLLHPVCASAQAESSKKEGKTHEVEEASAGSSAKADKAGSTESEEAKKGKGPEEEVEEVVEEEEEGEGAKEPEKKPEETGEAKKPEEKKPEEGIAPIEPAAKPKLTIPAFPPPGVSLVANDWASLKFIGVISTYYRASVTGIGDDQPGKAEWTNGFEVKRVRLIFAGGLWNEKVSFLLQGDMVETVLRDKNNANESGNAYLLDARINIFPLKGLKSEVLGGLGIAFGRFIPDFSYYMPRNIGLLDFVEYPAATALFAPWRQVGAEIVFNHKYVEAVVGIFNGMRFASKPKITVGGKDLYPSSEWLAPGYLGATFGARNNLVDDNKAKDYLVKIKGKIPQVGMWIEAFGYIAMPEFISDAGDHTYGYAITFGGEVGVEKVLGGAFKLKVIGGFLGRSVIFPKGAGYGNYTQMGGYLHAGLQIGRWVEPMIRLDYLNDRGQFLVFDKGVTGIEKNEKVWTLWPSVGVKFPLYGDHVQLIVADTFKHYASPHYDNSNDLTIQLILLL